MGIHPSEVNGKKAGLPMLKPKPQEIRSSNSNPTSNQKRKGFPNGTTKLIKERTTLRMMQEQGPIPHLQHHFQYESTSSVQLQAN